MPRTRHSACREREGKKNVCKGVDNHVNNDAVKTFKVRLLVLVQYCGLEHAAAEVEEHDAIENDRAEFSEEDPEVVAPEAFGLVFRAQPALILTEGTSVI